VYVRTRLTLLFVMILAVVLGAFSLVVFEATRAGVLDEIQNGVRTRATAIAKTAGPEFRNGLVRPLEAYVFTTPDTYVQLVDADGEVLERSGNLEEHALPFLEDSFEAGRVVEVHVDELPVFMYGAPVPPKGELQGYVVVGRSPGPLYQVLRRLQGVLIPWAVLSLTTMGLVAWFGVRRTMGPLARLANAASDIANSHDHTGRVGSTGRRDEIGRLAVTIDRMLEALEETHRQAQQARDEQRRFLADVSHELRAPLTIALSSLDLLEKVGPEDPDFRDRVVADLRGEIDRMARMITQLLMMARTGKGVAAANRPVLVGDLVAELCRQRGRGDGRVELQCRVGDLGDAVVMGNDDYLRQLFLILLDNAFEFTQGRGRIEVEGAVHNGTVRVSVMDTGVGIAAEDLERIFDRFYRGKNSRTSEGTGLGLSIARHIAQQHGGNVHVESKLGEGSRFIVSLPVLT